MKIEHLREFLILEKTRNFSEAAKILHISQSSLSKHIAALEDEVDVDLFKRLGNTLQLTEAGSVFLDGALILVNDHNSFVERMKAIKARNDAVLEIGYLSSVASFPLFAAVVYPGDEVLGARSGAFRHGVALAPHGGEIHVLDGVPGSQRQRQVNFGRAGRIALRDARANAPTRSRTRSTCAFVRVAQEVQRIVDVLTEIDVMALSVHVGTIFLVGARV